jgi:hypothetical protein
MRSCQRSSPQSSSWRTHLKCCRLQIAAWITRLAHNRRDRACALKDSIARALVGLPLSDQAAQALVEKLLVDDDVVSHGEGECREKPSGRLAAAEGGGGEKATSQQSRVRACDAETRSGKESVPSRGCAHLSITTPSHRRTSCA